MRENLRPSGGGKRVPGKFQSISFRIVVLQGGWNAWHVLTNPLSPRRESRTILGSVRRGSIQLARTRRRRGERDGGREEESGVRRGICYTPARSNEISRVSSRRLRLREPHIWNNERVYAVSRHGEGVPARVDRTNGAVSGCFSYRSGVAVLGPPGELDGLYTVKTI